MNFEPRLLCVLLPEPAVAVTVNYPAVRFAITGAQLARTRSVSRFPRGFPRQLMGNGYGPLSRRLPNRGHGDGRTVEVLPSHRS